MVNIVEWTFKTKIINSLILTENDKNNFIKFYKYMTNDERDELLTLI